MRPETAQPATPRPATSRPETVPTLSGTDEASTASASAPGELRSLERGLDALQTVEADRTGGWRRRLGRALPPVLLLVAAVAVWQLVVVIARPRPDLVPGPLEVASALGFAWDTGRVQLAVLTSLERGLLGFVVAGVLGTMLGLLMAEAGWLRRSLGPLVSGLQVLPSVAWVPAAILWFGLTDATVYFVVVMGAAPSIANGLLSGVGQVSPPLRRVGTVLGASRVQQALLVVLPAALPGYLGGLRQGWAFSWRSLMAAEIIATGGSIGFGLGALLQQSRELADLAAVMATILVILALGILIELVVFAPIERGLLRRRGLLVATRA